MRTYFSIIRSVTASGTTTNAANIIVPRKCILESVDFAGGLISTAAAGNKLGSVIVGRGGAGSLADSDAGKTIAATGAIVFGTAATTSSGVGFNKFCPIKLPLNANEVLVVTVGASTDAVAYGTAILTFSY